MMVRMQRSYPDTMKFSNRMESTGLKHLEKQEHQRDGKAIRMEVRSCRVIAGSHMERKIHEILKSLRNVDITWWMVPMLPRYL